MQEVFTNKTHEKMFLKKKKKRDLGAILCQGKLDDVACDCLVLVGACKDQLYSGWLHDCKGAFEIAVSTGCGGPIDSAAVR
jgi:hypothetical protein